MSIPLTTEQTYAIDEPVDSVTIDSFGGDVTVTCDAEPGRAEVVLSSGEPVDVGPVTVECHDGALRIDVPPLLPGRGRRGFALDLGPLTLGRGTEAVDIDVRVPRGTAVRIAAKAGDVELGGGAGVVDVTVGSGDVRTEVIGGGAVHAGAGSVEVEATEGDLLITTGAGDVDVESVRGDLAVKTGAGDVRVRLHQGSVEVTTGTGDIDVEVPRGIAVWLDLSSGLGDVARDLDSAGRPADGAPYLGVTANTGTGDIDVHH